MYESGVAARDSNTTARLPQPTVTTLSLDMVSVCMCVCLCVCLCFSFLINIIDCFLFCFVWSSSPCLSVSIGHLHLSVSHLKRKSYFNPRFSKLKALNFEASKFLPSSCRCNTNVYSSSEPSLSSPDNYTYVIFHHFKLRCKPGWFQLTSPELADAHTSASCGP